MTRPLHEDSATAHHEHGPDIKKEQYQNFLVFDYLVTMIWQ